MPRAEVLAVAVERLRRVLHASEAVASEDADRFDRELVARARRNRVRVHGVAVRRVDHRAVVADDLRIPEGVVVGDDGGDGGGAAPERAAREADRPRGVGPPDVSEDGNPFARRLHRRGRDARDLVVVEERALARRPAGHDPVHSLVDEALDVLPKHLELYSSFLVERRQKGDDHCRLREPLHDGGGLAA